MPHIHEKIDFTVEVFIVYKDKVLLRMHDKYKIWLSIGGHIELDEDPTEAALREVREEAGLNIKLVGNPQLPQKINDKDYKDITPPKFLGRNRVSPAHEHIIFVYFAKTDSDKISPENSADAGQELRWVTKNELAEMDLVPNVRFYAERALEELSN